MFKNRSIQMKFVKDRQVMHADKNSTINVIHLPKVNNVAVAVASLYTLKRVLDTTSVIAINKFVK